MHGISLHLFKKMIISKWYYSYITKYDLRSMYFYGQSVNCFSSHNRWGTLIMLQQIYQKDNHIFNSIVQSLKNLSYKELLELPQQEQLVITETSEYTTIEISTQYYEIDQAIHVIAIQFLWLEHPHNPYLIDKMHNIIVPLPNRNKSLIYSGHCKTEFFYALPDNTITDDVFIRNETAEKRIQEKADWFGTTGLSRSEEHQLPKYIRYEYGDLLIDDDGLKANDLEFLGIFGLNKKLCKQLNLSTTDQPKKIYIWHYKNEHFAYAYRDQNNILQYDLGSHCPIQELQKLKLV